jgi:PAS domain S-box-containing protein
MSAFAHAAVGMAITDLNGRFVGVNDAYCRITGYSCAELRSRDFLSITHPDYREWNAKFIRQMIEREVPAFVLEEPYIKKGGELLWVQNSVSLLHDREKKRVNIVVLCQDIAERKTVQEALREREEAKLEAERKYRDIFENANEGIFQTTPDGRFLTANPALARILGFETPEQLINERTNIASQQYADSARREEFKRLLEIHGIVRGFEYEAYRRDGSRIWISDSVRAVPREDGTILYYEGIAEDITERKRAERELRKQKEILQKVFDQIPLMISLVDEDGRLELVNGEWERTLGWTLREILEEGVDIFAECYPDPDYRKRVMSFVTQSNYGWEDFKTKTRDGRIIDTSWARLQLSDGTSIGIGKDITQQKRLEQLNAASADLARGLSGARSPLEAARMIVKTADEMFGWDSCTLDLYDSEKNALQPILNIDNIGQERQDITPFLTGQPPTPRGRRVIEKGAELIVREVPYLFEKSAVPSARRLATIMSVPIRYGPSIIGLFSIQSYKPHPYTQASLGELQSLADMCGQALNRMRAEQSLYESEERFRQIAENIDEVIWMVDLGMKNLLYINPAYERIWGRSCESAYARIPSVLEAVHPDDRKKAEKMVQQRLRGDYQSLEYRIKRPDDSVRWIRTRAFPIRDAEGTAYRLAGIAEDITERKRAESEMRSYSRRLIEAQESERKHIARELHDEIGQVLTAVRINLQSLEQLCDRSSIVNQVAEDIRVIDEALKRVRDLSFELRPSLLDDLGLAAATRWYVDRYLRRTAIKADVRIDSEISQVRLSRNVETACFRILQEALANVVRHAQAENVSITLRSFDSTLMLSVKDNGIGIQSARLQNSSNQSSKLGLRGMEERALAVAGRLEILSTQSLGTEIRASFPIFHAGNGNEFPFKLPGSEPELSGQV